MAGHPRLYRRGATYYHRAAIPTDIKNTYPKSEETFSLRTKDYQEALRKVRAAAVEVDQRFESHRVRRRQDGCSPLKELTDEQIKAIEEIYFQYLLDEDEDIRLEKFYEAGGPLYDTPRYTFEEYCEIVDGNEEAYRYYYARGIVDSFFSYEAREVLTWSNVDIHLSPESESWDKLARALQVASIKATEAIKARNAGVVVETPQVASDVFQPSSPCLSSAVRAWIDERVRTTWVPKTEHEHRVWMEHFVTVTGDRPIADYTKSDARKFKAILLKLPANWNKQEVLKGLPIDKAAERASELGMVPMSDSNVNKLLGFVGSFWNWAEDNYDDAPSNPFKGIKIKVRRDVGSDRDPFRPDELQAIFSAPLFTGCLSVRKWKVPGDLIPKDAGIFWVPLISLFSGARLGEIIQLYTSDIREDNGIYYFDINADGDDKRLKTRGSKRIIPIHPKLIDIGLMNHVKKSRAVNGVRLFPDLPLGRDGYYSSPFSKHFNRFLNSIGIKRAKNAFHSFRHCFEDACRENNVSKEIMDHLQGHVEAGMSSRYGSGYSLQTLNEAMKKIAYRDLDLSHLLLK